MRANPSELSNSASPSPVSTFDGSVQRNSAGATRMSATRRHSSNDDTAGSKRRRIDRACDACRRRSVAFFICQSRPLYIQAGKQNAMGRRCRRIYAPTVPKAASTVHTCKSKISIVILVSHNYTGRSLSLEGHLKR